MLPHLWRLSLRSVRAVLGLGCFFVYLPSSNYAVTAVGVLLLLFLVWGVASFFTRRFESGIYATVALALDTLFFCVWAVAVPEGAGAWVSAVFFTYLLASALLLHNWLRLMLVFLVAAALAFLPFPWQPQHLGGTVLAGGLIASVGALQKRTLEERLSNSARQGVLFRSESQRAREAERQRIAADFHDGPLQHFISFQMRLEILRKLLARNKDTAEEELRQLQELCSNQVHELRSFVRSMRPVDEGVSLSASISRMVEQFQRDTGIAASFLSGDLIDPSETEVSLELLQIVREALNNVQKHSGASRVAISISKLDQTLEISVEDNGGGFPFSGSYTLDEMELLRLGPVSIKRRVRVLNGELTVESKPGQGASLQIRVPL